MTEQTLASAIPYACQQQLLSLDRNGVQEQNKTHTGILFLLASIGFITVIDTTAKYMSPSLPAMEVVWGYFLGIFICVTAMAACRAGRLPRLLATRRPLLQLLRAGLLVLAVSLLFLALQYMTLADATAISFTSPLFVILLAIPILGERVDRARWLAVFAGLCGVLVIVRPGSGLASWVSLLPLLGAASFGGFQIATRLLASTESNFTTLFYTGAGGVLWSTFFLPFFWVTPELWHWFTFLVLGILGVVAHLFMIKAFEHADETLLGERGVAERVAGAVEADDKTVADQHVVSNAAEVDDVLQAGLGRRRRGQQKR